LSRAVRDFSGDLDRIIVMPTCKMARPGAFQVDHAKFTGLASSASEHGCEVAFSSPKDGQLMEGAALCALTELQTVQLMRSWKPVLREAKSLQALSDSQIRAFFDRLDTSGDGDLELAELVDALHLIGVSKDPETLRLELDKNDKGSVCVDEFVDWWMEHVNKAKVITLTSSGAWQELLDRAPPPGYSQLVLLIVTFTFCRSCRAFEPKFRQLAEEYPTVRFVNMIGNGTIGAMELCTQRLAVKASPAFFVFRRGGEMLAQWVGKNPATLKQRLEECLEADAAGKSVAA